MSETQQIPEMAQEAIKQLASQHGGDPDDLREEFLELVNEERDKGVSNPEKRALRRLSLSQKGGQMQDTEQLRGYVLGASDPINTSRSTISQAKDYIEKQGVERAVKQGLVKKVPSGKLPDELASITVTKDDEDEVYAVLDNNGNSPTSGEVLPAEDYIRYVYGVVWRGADDGPHWFSGVLDADEAGDKPPVPTKYESVSFEAVWVGESDQNNTIRLRFRDSEPFETTDDFGGPDVLDLFEDDDLIGHVSLEDADADNYSRNDVAATYGSVTYMELAPDNGQSRRLSVVDPFAFGSDLSRTVWLPDHVDVNFAEESDVYIIGQVSPSNNEYPDSIEALGVFVHPDYRVDRSGVESMGDDEADDDEPSPAELGEEGLDPSEFEPEPDSKESESVERESEDEDREATTDGGNDDEENADRGDFEPTDDDEEWSW